MQETIDALTEMIQNETPFYLHHNEAKEIAKGLWDAFKTFGLSERFYSIIADYVQKYQAGEKDG
jgi:hypothetical protein